MKNRKVKNHTFEYVKNNSEDVHDEIGYYQCRGALCFDDDHDQVPEPGLWKAALVLTNDLRKEGFEAEPEYSEKGWVEVYVLTRYRGRRIEQTKKELE